MTEIKKTLTILKARWMEVVFLIGLPLLAKLPFWLAANKLLATRYVNLLYLVLGVPLCVVLIIARSGFLRTIYLEDQKRQSPFTLLRVGIHFLWRMFVWSLIYSVPFLIWVLLYSRIVIAFIRPADLSFPHFGLWINHLCSAGIKLALMKIILLVPALIIVLDYQVFGSFKMLKQCRLSSMKELVILYCVSIAIGLFGSVLPLYCRSTSGGAVCCGVTTTLQYILRFIFPIVTKLIDLTIAVMAVRFVGSLDLVYDNKPVSLDFEDLRKYTNRDLKE